MDTTLIEEKKVNGEPEPHMMTKDEVVSLPPAPPPLPSGSASVGRRSRSRDRRSGSHRRASSADVPRMVQGSFPPVPPPVGAPQYAPHYPYSMGPYPPPYGAPPPPPGSTDQAMWEMHMQQQQARSGIPPLPGGPSGNTENRPLLPQQRREHHRRSHSSSSASPAGYGAFWNQSAPPSPSSQRTNFNPRGEFMNLTSNFRQPESPRSSSPLTVGGKPAIPSSPRNGYKVPGSPRNTYPHGQWSPLPPPIPQANMSYGPAIPMNGIPPPNDPSALSPYPSQVSNGLPPSATSSLHSNGGEAVFMAQRKSISRQESVRRRHMRQQSAQLFMAEVKGTEQPLQCQNVVFLLLFVFHLLGMVFLFNTYSYEALKFHDPVEEQTDSVTIYYQNLVIVASICGSFAICFSTLLLGVMTFFARKFVQVALILIITLSFVWGTVGIGLSPKNVVPVTGIIALALTVAYAIIVWERIPFAAANLLTALSAIRAFPGTVLLAFFFQMLGLAWSIYHAVIVCGIYDSIQDGRIVLTQRQTIVVYVLLGISYYWTYQVLLNVVQVATAGVIGSWWHQPDGEHAVKRSSFKTIFYSIGSVCFGSLFVGPVRVIQQLSVLFRPSSDEASLLCLHECLNCIRSCLTSCVDGLSARINPWAFTYVGLYGYGFLEAGQLATEVFEKRGWTTIVSDDLVPNVLFMTSLVVGGLTGCLGYLLAGLESLHVSSIDEPQVVSFFVGIVIGLVVTSILFGAISSSVNAVTVCFATSPVDFEENHPDLSRDMRSAWREVWPGALDVVDLRLALAGNNSAPHGGPSGHPSEVVTPLL